MSLKHVSRAIGSRAIVQIDREAGKSQALEQLKKGVAFASAGALEAGIRCFESAARLDPNSPDAFNNLGIAFQRLGRIDEAEARYREALLTQPDFDHARLNLGSMLLALGRCEEALEVVQEGSYSTFELFDLAAEILGRTAQWSACLAACEESLLIRPNGSRALHLKAMALKALNRNEEALHAFEAAEACGSAVIFADKGWLLAEMGRREEAILAFDSALQIDPNLSAAWGRRSYLLRTVSRDDLTAMERLLSHHEASREDRINLSFALGQAYLKEGDGVRAFARLEEGNRLKRSTLDYDPESEERRAREIRSVFTPEMLANYAGQGDLSAAPIFVFGMPRSGTTLVEQILASHPSAFGGGEPTFLFDAIAASGGVVEIWKLGNKYLQMVAESAPKGTRFVDKMPWNFLYAGLISLALPNAKMIHCRRDPLDTCVSCYSTLFARGQEFSYDLTELGRYYRMYEQHMAYWRGVLGSERFIEVEYERLVTDTEEQVRRLLSFCELDWDAACLQFHESERKVTSASLDQVRSPIYRSSLGRGEALRPWLGDLERALTQG